ncbi:WD40-like Beta Propeller Repeat [Tenacibaculum sp. MAR_2009_124]|uniref:PD40 domain-containing protein n=1 Tax=Tenacibaculum sp. MAR_2009_124 TaxID=1250059 RepID=UPI0008966D81|nr:PD40 domain-containing protein [Tenacibaculum sp. MAR_2009_124]SEB46622.1 WD40-like Beta Propeller Repeat [Tenacibaculum sp. MAR_2009_124]
MGSESNFKTKGSPFFSSNNNIIYLGNSFSERTGNGNWSEIKKLKAPFDSLPIMRLSVSDKGTYFFDEFKRDFTGDIRYSGLVNGKHEKPKKLNAKINTGRSFHPFIAPDESYLLFDSDREGGYGDSDIYISFRQQDGSWGDPINLGNKINTAAWEAAASITPDGKFLFFNRTVGEVPYENDDYKNVNIFWVDAEIIQGLRPKE